MVMMQPSEAARSRWAAMFQPGDMVLIPVSKNDKRAVWVDARSNGSARRISHIP